MSVNLTPLTVDLIQELTFLVDYSMSMRLFSDHINERLSEIQSTIEQSETEMQRAYAQGIHDGMILATNDMNNIYNATAINYNLISQENINVNTDSEEGSNDNN
jgi:hypothetical protein